MKRIVNLVITVGANGEAVIEIPHDKNPAGSAEAAASFTDQLSKALGEVIERHINDHHHHHHDHHHDHLRTGGTA